MLRLERGQAGHRQNLLKDPHVLGPWTMQIGHYHSSPAAHHRRNKRRNRITCLHNDQIRPRHRRDKLR